VSWVRIAAFYLTLLPAVIAITALLVSAVALEYVRNGMCWCGERLLDMVQWLEVL
jgi:hypothetical protein